MIKKELVKVKLKDLVEYENNTKEHTSEQIQVIRDSIISLEDLDPIQIDENNVILCGHGRKQAWMQIDSTGEKEVEVLKIVGLSEGAKKAWRIASNKIPSMTGFDLDKLGKEFNLLEDTDFFEDTGFSTKEISELWDKDEKEDTSELIESDKTSVIEHTCPSCGHVYEQEIKKSNKRR
jgi:hypothetical protein